MASTPLAAEHDVGAILRGHRGKPDLDVGHVDTLVLGERSTVLDDAVHVVTVHILNGKRDQAIVDEDGRTGGDLMRQVLVVDVEAFGRPWDSARRGNDMRPLLELDGLVRHQLAGADFGTLGVQENGYGNRELVGDAAHALDVAAVVLVAAVGEVEASDVHAMQDELAQYLVVLGCRAHGADDLGPLLLFGHVTPQVGWPYG